MNGEIVSGVAPLTGAEQIVQKISVLKEMLQQSLHGYESILQQIHINLAKDPEIVTLLTPEEVGVIVAGLAKRKGIIIATTSTAKAKTASGKSLKNVGLEDI
jgi:hypothetical protein